MLEKIEYISKLSKTLGNVRSMVSVPYCVGITGNNVTAMSLGTIMF